MINDYERQMTPGEAFTAGWRDAMREELQGSTLNGRSAVEQTGENRTWGHQVADEYGVEAEWRRGWAAAQYAISDARSSAKFLDLAYVVDLPSTCPHGRVGACPHCIGVST